MSKVSWKFLIFLTLSVFSIWELWPSLNWLVMSNDKKKEQTEINKSSSSRALRLGLDLKGGTYILLEIDSLHLDNDVKMKDAVDRVIEIIRNRIDQFGIVEPMVAKRGDKWIVVQLPGIKDPEAAKNLIGKTAALEFRIVNTSKESNQVLNLLSEKGITPSQYRENLSLYPDIESIMPDGASIFENKRGTMYYVLGKPLLTGSALTNAKVEFYEEFGQPVVSVDFSKDGSKVFADITDKNKGKNLAIVIDGIVQSDPVINSKIPDGRAIIEGNFTTEDARLLASVLRAGALPVPIKIIEERTVGPSLGDDAIKKGVFSSLVAVSAIFIFMIIYYRLSGLIANIALSLNIMILAAVMIFLQFTITLPGLAGAALMLAMSVDANVLILERMREELATGKIVRVAVDRAYQKVFWTIFDANVTTIIAAIFLFQFGTGPIKGFAVTISIGLIISMFTAITVTKLIYEFLFRKNIFFKIRV